MSENSETLKKLFPREPKNIFNLFNYSETTGQKPKAFDLQLPKTTKYTISEQLQPAMRKSLMNDLNL